MAVKKKTKKKQTKSKRTAGNKMTPMKKTAKKKARQKSARGKTKAVGQKAIGAKTVSGLKKRVRKKSQTVDAVAYPREGLGARSGRQLGDLQGLSSVEGADSESVGELLEEGNAFEADVITGVEEAGHAEEREIRTREVPEDDVPSEYLDKE
jgi:hypothetical protein